MQKKILVITPKFPLPATGACEQERLAGIQQLKQLGFKVRVIAKIFDWQNKGQIKDWAKDNGVEADLIEYEFTKNKKGREKINQVIRKIVNPLNWDGAAHEYAAKNTHKFVSRIAEEWRPDIVWFDYTYLWPVYKIFQNRNIPIITRSINFEPLHFLHEDGVNLKNLLKFLPKMISELIIIRRSNFIFAITPKEEKMYKILGAKNISVLPLRSLPKLFKKDRIIGNKKILHLFFMGASYNVHHSRKAVELIIKDVAPVLQKKFPDKFIFHILGKKLPVNLKKYCTDNVVEEGFVDDLEKFLEDMDIAVIPSIMGAGMQQKIFEPLVRGISTVTSPRGLAAYPFKDGEHLLLAKIADDYVNQIIKLQDAQLRKRLSRNALKLCKKIFSQDMLDNIVQAGIKQAIK